MKTPLLDEIGNRMHKTQCGIAAVARPVLAHQVVTTRR
jgi:hypothetical protein